MFAAFVESHAVAELLLKNKADVNARDHVRAGRGNGVGYWYGGEARWCIDASDIQCRDNGEG